MTNLQRIGVLAHPNRPSTIPFAETVVSSLESSGYDAWLLTAWEADDARPLVKDSHIVVAIGGDGAMLRAARVCSPYGVPILGINAGYLGFLTEASPDDWPRVLERLAASDYWVEERMMLELEVWRDNLCIATADALNDVVISRGAIARSVWLETYIDDNWTTTYNADGLIIATPTGSTAYALAVGGPILPPELHNILIVPVAPHLSMERPLVLSEGVSIKVRVVPRPNDGEVTITVDGEFIKNMMGAGDFAVIRASDNFSRFVRLREQGYFYRSLLDRLEPRLAIQYHDESPMPPSSVEATPKTIE